MAPTGSAFVISTESRSSLRTRSCSNWSAGRVDGDKLSSEKDRQTWGMLVKRSYG